MTTEQYAEGDIVQVDPNVECFGGWTCPDVLNDQEQQPAAQEAVAIERVYQTIIHWDDGGKRSRRELARRIVDLYTTPHPAPASAELPDEREVFEKWAASASKTFILDRCARGYDDWMTDWTWKAWQARSAQAVPDERDKCDFWEWAEAHMIGCEDCGGIDSPERWRVSHSKGTDFGFTLKKAVEAARAAAKGE